MAKAKRQVDESSTDSSEEDEENGQASGGAEAERGAEEATVWREARKKADEDLKALREQREREEARGVRRKSVFPPRIPQWRQYIHDQWKAEDAEISQWKKAKGEGKANLAKLREEREKAGSSGRLASSTKIPQWRKEIYDEWNRKEEEEAKWRKARDDAKVNLGKLREDRKKTGAKGSGSATTAKIPQWKKEIYEEWEREDAEQTNWKKAKDAAKSSLAKLREERENAPRRKSVFPPRIPQWKKEAHEQWEKEDAADAKWRESRQKADAALTSQKDAQKKREAQAAKAALSPKSSKEKVAKPGSATKLRTAQCGPVVAKRSATSIPIGGARRKVPSEGNVAVVKSGASRSRIPVLTSASTSRLTHQAELELKPKLLDEKNLMMAKARKKADADMAARSEKLPTPIKKAHLEPTKAEIEAKASAERIARMEKAKAEATARSRAGIGRGARGRGAGRGGAGRGRADAKRPSAEAVEKSSDSKLKRAGSDTDSKNKNSAKQGRAKGPPASRRDSSPL